MATCSDETTLHPEKIAPRCRSETVSCCFVAVVFLGHPIRCECKASELCAIYRPKQRFASLLLISAPRQSKRWARRVDGYSQNSNGSDESWIGDSYSPQ